MLNYNKISNDIPTAVAALQDGHLVAFPTETVYGLGANASDPAAMRQVFAAKGRPIDHPLIVHIATADQMTLWARDIPKAAWSLAAKFWPGALTVILNKQSHVSDLITGGQDTIGLRIPNHPITLQLLQQFGGAIVGPSANKYGRVSPTSAEHVAADLHAEVAVILDGGSCAVGIESTIIDLTAVEPTIMRSGAISAAAIAEVLGCDIKLQSGTVSKIRTPGSHAAHYAPITPAYLIASSELMDTVAALQNENADFSVISFTARDPKLPNNIYWQHVILDPQTYAHNLYANLREHDALNGKYILIEQPPQGSAWLAIMDRLNRACYKANASVVPA